MPIVELYHVGAGHARRIDGKESALSDGLGGSLPQAVSFGFSTAAPVVAGTYPEDGMVDAGPREPLTVTFSTLMEHGSAEGSIS